MTDLASTKGPQSGKATKNSVQERLLALQLKKNQARVLAHKATEDEKEEKEMGPNALQKKERLAAKERKEQFEKKLAEEGDDPERYQRLHRTEEMLEGEYKKKSKKHARNPDVFGAGAAFRAFKKRKLQFGMDGEAYVEQRDALGDEFYSPTESLAYGQTVNDDPYLVELLVEDQDEARRKGEKFSRRRKWDDNRNIDFINEKNRRYNEKVSRAFDKYTEDIRENLERGTAL